MIWHVLWGLSVASWAFCFVRIVRILLRVRKIKDVWERSNELDKVLPWFIGIVGSLAATWIFYFLGK